MLGEFPMDDSLIQPCSDGCERWGDLYNKVERERASIDSTARFEHCVQKRYSSTMSDASTDAGGDSRSEKSDSDDSDWESALADPPDLSSWYGDTSPLSFIEELPEFGKIPHRQKHPGGNS